MVRESAVGDFCATHFAHLVIVGALHAEHHTIEPHFKVAIVHIDACARGFWRTGVENDTFSRQTEVFCAVGAVVVAVVSPFVFSATSHGICHAVHLDCLRRASRSVDSRKVVTFVIAHKAHVAHLDVATVDKADAANQRAAVHRQIFTTLNSDKGWGIDGRRWLMGGEEIAVPFKIHISATAKESGNARHRLEVVGAGAIFERLPRQTFVGPVAFVQRAHICLATEVGGFQFGVDDIARQPTAVEIRFAIGNHHFQVASLDSGTRDASASENDGRAISDFDIVGFQFLSDAVSASTRHR